MKPLLRELSIDNPLPLTPIRRIQNIERISAFMFERFVQLSCMGVWGSLYILLACYHNSTSWAGIILRKINIQILK